MQLKKDGKKPQNIRDSLAMATCTLLAGVAPQAQAADFQSPWQIDGGLLIYAEKDRVHLVEPVLRIRKEIDDGEFVTTRLVADALTGASPNGAAPSPDQAQTFTSPSGGSAYTTKPNEIPLDTTFKDTRGAVNVEWEKPLSERLRGIFGASFSAETDYTSFGVSASLSQDFNQRNTTLTAAVSLDADSVSPLGGAPDPFTPMSATVVNGEGEGEGGGPSKSKTVQQYMLGVTQVLGRNTLMQLNYSYGHSSGYLTDPYKILSVLANDGSGNLRTPASGDLPYVYEKRPDSRTFQTVYWKGIHQFGEDVLTLAYRYGWDDWGINSNTYDVRYRWELGNGHYLQPHFRHYQQSAADFYRQTILDSELPTLNYASADSRLGELTTKTVGLKYGIAFDKDSEVNLRVEYMHQTGKTRAQDAVGKLQNLDLFPENKAAIIQLGISMNTDTLARRLRTAFYKLTK
jgi:hypothetical protein